MSKIMFFGTCAGAEPIDGMHHLSFAIEKNGEYYFFDAGENCSRTAHLMGVDLLKVRSIFISHTHMDHIGGLENLLWNIRKISGLKGEVPIDEKVEVYIPNIESWNGIMTVLKNTEGNFECAYRVEGKRPFSGVVYENDAIKVSAMSNHHIKPKDDGVPLSYSYIIEVDGKRIAFSGDLGNMDDLRQLLEGGCDYLMIETGHYKVVDLLSVIEAYDVKKILFVHNGREIINNVEAVEATLEKSKIPAQICRDKMILEI